MVVSLVINTRVLTITSQDARFSCAFMVSRPLHPITVQSSRTNIQKHLRDMARLENSIKPKHDSCFAEKPLTHSPREPAEASAEFLMTLTGQQCRKVFLHCRTLCCHFWVHVRVSDFKLK